MPLKNEKIVLIGGAGFIGHNLALHLASYGYSVEIVDGLSVNNLLAFAAQKNQMEYKWRYYHFLNERLELLKTAGIPLHIEDARDYHALSRVLTRIQPTMVVHLAAIAHADQSNKDPYSTFDHSLRTLENALDWSRGSDIKRFVYFSSSMVYGNFAQGEVTEETPCNPIGIYGALKLSGEKIVIGYNQVFNLPYTIVRPSALYGERCVSRRVAQIFVENALQGQEITISGDGEECLDFTYIEDLVSGVRNVLESDQAVNQTFNLTYGSGRSINDLYKIVHKVFPNAKVKYLERDRLVPRRGTLSVERAKTMIGYNPRFPLEVGYEKYIRWYQSAWKTSQ